MSVYKQEGSDWSTETYTLQDLAVQVHVHAYYICTSSGHATESVPQLVNTSGKVYVLVPHVQR